jgi:hypothetical protein
MTVHPGRFSAAIEGNFVVFLTGMRISKPMKIRSTGAGGGDRGGAAVPASVKTPTGGKAARRLRSSLSQS